MRKIAAGTFGVSLMAFVAAGQTAPQERRPEQQAERSRQAGTSDMMLSENLIGMEVTHRGEKVGEIEQLVLDSTGKARYAIVAVGGLAGIGAHDVAVPWDELTVAGEEISIQRSEEQLRAMPAFDKQAWETEDAESWARDVDQAFSGAGSRRASEEDSDVLSREEREDTTEARTGHQTGEREPGEREMEQRAERREGQQPRDLKELFASGSQETIQGEVARVEKSARLEGLESGTVLHVKTKDGQTMRVFLAPTPEAKNLGLELGSNVMVEIQGSRVDLQGQPVILASELTIKLREKDGSPVRVEEEDR